MVVAVVAMARAPGIRVVTLVACSSPVGVLYGDRATHEAGFDGSELFVPGSTWLRPPSDVPRSDGPEVSGLLLLVILPKGVQLLCCVDDEVCEGVSCCGMAWWVASGRCLFCWGWTTQPALLRYRGGSGWATSLPLNCSTAVHWSPGAASPGGEPPLGSSPLGGFGCFSLVSHGACSLPAGGSHQRVSRRGWVVPLVGESSQHLCLALVVPFRLV